MPRIEILTETESQIVPFNGPTLRIGRDAGNDVVLNEKLASRQHCILEVEGGNFRIKDLKSSNGTWVGDNRIIEASVDFGDIIRIGKTRLRLLPDEVVGKKGRKVPTAVVVEDSPEELPSPAPGDNTVATTLAARALAAGPLSKQLAPMMLAVANVPRPPGSPDTAKDFRLLSRRGQELQVKSRSGDESVGESVEALRQLLFVAFRTRATDIHIEPKGATISVRFRIDGQMHTVGQMSSRMGVGVLNVIKVLCEADISKKQIVQEGNFSVDLASRRVDFRVNMTPTVHGQKLALRFLDKGTVPDHFSGLGMTERAVMEMERVTSQDSGMVILAGPTGSGKTTTLYTALKGINAETRNIITIEDPVEYELANTTQISIDPRHNLTFSSVLSSVLRQDPDVILVGEIRDQETAKMAMQAATTGHLVLTTIHARDTVGTIFRLLDLGVEPFLIASAVTMCISQRLVRTLCDNCKRPFKPDAAMIRAMKIEGRQYGHFYDAVGCKKCMNVGYRGRTALFEMLMFNPQLRDVILTRPTISDIRKAAGEWMFETLTECGFRYVMEGKTTFQEVDRVSGMA
ncbi:MAG: Flp pilus assembly complex ATPase component TadA [Phycisphaerae bacterium]|nr:Flp pilus assembly complex ATPase component TadA [Phycisphaerae bacterium]